MAIKSVAYNKHVLIITTLRLMDVRSKKKLSHTQFKKGMLINAFNKKIKK